MHTLHTVFRLAKIIKFLQRNKLCLIARKSEPTWNILEGHRTNQVQRSISVSGIWVKLPPNLWMSSMEETVLWDTALLSLLAVCPSSVISGWQTAWHHTHVVPVLKWEVSSVHHRASEPDPVKKAQQDPEAESVVAEYLLVWTLGAGLWLRHQRSAEKGPNLSLEFLPVGNQNEFEILSALVSLSVNPQIILFQSITVLTVCTLICLEVFW